MICGGKYDEENCMKKYKEGDKNHFISLLKSKRIKNKKDYNVEDIKQEARVVMVNVMKKFRIDRIFTNE